MAPKELPTLPGIGGEGPLYKRFDTPTYFRNSKYIESLQVKRIILDEEDKETPVSTTITPKAVSKAPVISRQPWDPVLGDSEHAYAWWTLAEDETIAIINEQKKRSYKRPASHIAGPPPAYKGPTVPKGSVAGTPPASKGPNVPKGSIAKQPSTTVKSGSVPPKAASATRPPAVTVPSVPIQGLDLTLPSVELSAPNVPQPSLNIGFQGNAGVREPSQVRGRKSTSGQGIRVPHAQPK